MEQVGSRKGQPWFSLALPLVQPELVMSSKDDAGWGSGGLWSQATQIPLLTTSGAVASGITLTYELGVTAAHALPSRVRCPGYSTGYCMLSVGI